MSNGQAHGHDKHKDLRDAGFRLPSRAAAHHADRIGDRIKATKERVGKHTSTADKLRAAMDDLEEDVLHSLENDTKEAQKELIETFHANREHWIEMILGSAKAKK